LFSAFIVLATSDFPTFYAKAIDEQASKAATQEQVQQVPKA
jgi:hypothetical protein